MALDLEPGDVGRGRGGTCRFLVGSPSRSWGNRFPELSGPSKCLSWFASLLDRTLVALRGYAAPGPILGRYRHLASFYRCKASLGNCSKGKNPFRAFAPHLWAKWAKPCARASRLIHLLLCSNSQTSFEIYAKSLQFHLEYWQAIALEHSSRLHSSERSEASRSFANWLDGALAGGASLAHRATKPRPWSSPVVVHGANGLTSAKSEVLASYADTWGELWLEKPACCFATHPLLDCPLALPGLTPSQLRAVAKSFPHKTDVRDGLHPRHFALFSDKLLEALALLFRYMEATGMCPLAVSSVIIALIPKPTGGVRPIGLLRSFVRIWERSRRSLVSAWETAEASGPEFLASKGRSSLDAVWRKSVLAEIAVSKREVFATLLADLRKCYDHISHSVLAARGGGCGFPIAILRLSLLTYSWSRRLQLQGAFSRVIWPSRSIIAGSCFATYQLKVALRSIIWKVMQAHPSASIGFFVDDASVSASGSTSFGVANTVAGASADLLAALRNDDLDISLDKTSVVSSSSSCAKRIAAQLGLPTCTIGKSAKDLGVDFTAGNRLSSRHLSVFAWRRAKTKFRVNKIAAFSSVRRASHRLFFTGALPASSFGVEVIGATDKVIASLRRDAASCLGISGHRRSLDLTFGLVSRMDPGALAAVAPLVRYAKEVWLASTPGCDSSVIKYISLIKGFHSSILCGKAYKSWGYSRGRLGAAFFAARRIGWTFTSPVIAVDTSGCQCNLFQLSPREVNKLALSAFAHASLVKGFGRLSDIDLPVDRDRTTDAPFVAPVVAAFNSKKLSKQQSSALLRNFAGGTYVASDLIRMGFQLPDLCPLCLASPDTLVHRFYYCVCTQHLWAALPKRLLVAARNGSSLYFTRAICSADLSIPAPVLAATFHFHDLLGDEEGFRFRSVDGPVYYDGSCSNPRSPALARASFAAVQINDDGHVVKSLQGAVPRSLKQSANIAEHCGLASTFFYADPDVEAYGDCMSTISAFGHGQVWAEFHARPAASVWRSIRLYSRGKLASVNHVKAHRSLSEIDVSDRLALMGFHGNSRADRLAKEANSLHPDISHAAEAYHRKFFDLKVIASQIGKALALFLSFRSQTLGVGFVKPVKKLLGRRQAHKHSTTWIGDRWLCTQCCATSSSRHGPSYSCQLKHHLADALLADRKGHDLAVVVVDSISPLFFCKKCGCFAAVKGVGLFEQCRVSSFREPDRMGKQCLKKIYAGKHPTHKRRSVSRPADLVLPPKQSLLAGVSSLRVFSPS